MLASVKPKPQHDGRRSGETRLVLSETGIYHFKAYFSGFEGPYSGDTLQLKTWDGLVHILRGSL